MGAELLECPFCGALPFVGPEHPATEGDDWSFIECRNFNHCPASPRVEAFGKTHRERAERKWNTRTSPHTRRGE